MIEFLFWILGAIILAVIYSIGKLLEDILEELRGISRKMGK